MFYFGTLFLNNRQGFSSQVPLVDRFRLKPYWFCYVVVRFLTTTTRIFINSASWSSISMKTYWFVFPPLLRCPETNEKDSHQKCVLLIDCDENRNGLFTLSESMNRINDRVNELIRRIESKNGINESNQCIKSKNRSSESKQ